MTPAARLQAAIEILDGLGATAMPADRFIRNWFRARRYAGAKDRAAIGERVFDILRHRNSFAWRMQGDSPHALAIASLLREGQDIDSTRSLFSGEGYGPAPLTEAEANAIRMPPRGEPPDYVRSEYPQWLEPELARAFGDRLLDEMRALQSRAPIDLRVNTLKANRGVVLEPLRAEGYDASPGRHSPFAIRVPAGASRLDKTGLFQSGVFEFQDEASQIVALLVDAKPGMRVLDLAAGAGGKSLAMAAQMQNKGELIVSDIDARRLVQIAERARRAGVSIVFPPPRGCEGEGATVFDRVLVDAPCSGTGTWRRQPELRWRLTPERLETLKETQASLLDEGARRIKPGGRLIYATCSILPSESEDRIAAFLERHSAFTIVPAREVWRESVGIEPPPGMDEFFRATPLSTGTDGFFAAVLALPA